MPQGLCTAQKEGLNEIPTRVVNRRRNLTQSCHFGSRLSSTRMPPVTAAARRAIDILEQQHIDDPLGRAVVKP